MLTTLSTLYKNASRNSAGHKTKEALQTKRVGTSFPQICDSTYLLTFFNLGEIPCLAAELINGTSRCWQNNSHQHISLYSALPWYFLHCDGHVPPHIWPGLAFPSFLHTHSHTHTHTHGPWRWKQKSSSITCITASCSDQLTTTKCPRKSIFFSLWDLSALLTSNFIFIDHSLFSSI